MPIFKLRFFFGFVLALILISGCAAPLGDRIDGENLKVYYLEDVSKQMAIDFAKYWIANGFVGEKEQTIQLLTDEDKVIVKLIEKESYHDESLGISEVAMLQDLERVLKSDVFQKDVRIWICDDTFFPLRTARD
jgi:hypothetical protein